MRPSSQGGVKTGPGRNVRAFYVRELVSQYFWDIKSKTSDATQYPGYYDASEVLDIITHKNASYSPGFHDANGCLDLMSQKCAPTGPGHYDVLKYSRMFCRKCKVT